MHPERPHPCLLRNRPRISFIPYPTVFISFIILLFIPSVGWDHNLLPPYVVSLTRDIVLLNQSSGLGISDMFTYLQSYDVIASLSLDPYALEKRHAWNLDPSLIALRRNGGRQLLSVWEDLSRASNHTSREGNIPQLSLWMTCRSSHDFV